jgi:hypothetical protein
MVCFIAASRIFGTICTVEKGFFIEHRLLSHEFPCGLIERGIFRDYLRLCLSELFSGVLELEVLGMISVHKILGILAIAN